MIVYANIFLETIADVKEFVSAMNECKSDEVDLKADRYTVSAKSLMGIFSLDLAQPIVLAYPIEIEGFIKEKVLSKWGVSCEG